MRCDAGDSRNITRLGEPILQSRTSFTYIYGLARSLRRPALIINCHCLHAVSRGATARAPEDSQPGLRRPAEAALHAAEEDPAADDDVPAAAEVLHGGPEEPLPEERSGHCAQVPSAGAAGGVPPAEVHRARGRGEREGVAGT